MEQFTAAPVVVILYKRPDHTRRMLAELARVRPATLLVIADGPKHDADAAACAAARAVVDEVDWPCEIRRNYSGVNLGCQKRISGGLDWVFGQFERAVIVEDDCLPDPSFFRFCGEMLDRYADDERVMAVSGDNFQHGRRFTPHSYYFSSEPHCWGWATWRRAWRHNDVTMAAWPAARDGGLLLDTFKDPSVARFVERALEGVYAGRTDSWAYPWAFSCYLRRGLTVLPAVNLVTNVGVGADSTHCHKPDPFTLRPAEAMAFPLDHPPAVEHLLEADLAYFHRAIDFYCRPRPTG